MDMNNRIRGAKSREVSMIILHGTIFIAAIVVAIACNDHISYGGFVMFGALTMAMWWILRRFYGRWMAPPDYVTRLGVAVWTNGLTITKPIMEAAEQRFMDVMLDKASRVVTEQELLEMLSNTGIEWLSGRVEMWTGRYEIRDHQGIQHGHRIVVRWPGNIADSALFHELLHEVNETIRLPKIKDEAARIEFRANDCQHKEPLWWMLEGIMPEDY